MVVDPPDYRYANRVTKASHLLIGSPHQRKLWCPLQPCIFTGRHPADFEFVPIDARLLPFLEEENLQNLIDWQSSYKSQPAVTQVRVASYLCPSEVNDNERPDGALMHYPLNYGVTLRTWFVYDPTTQRGGNGLVYPNSRTRMANRWSGLGLLAEGRQGYLPRQLVHYVHLQTCPWRLGFHCSRGVLSPQRQSQHSFR